MEQKHWISRDARRACEKYDHTDTRVLKSISSRSINIHVDGYYGLMVIVSRLGWRIGRPSFFPNRMYPFETNVFLFGGNLKVQNLHAGCYFHLNDIG